MTPTAKLAKILRTSEDVVLSVEDKMNRITGKTGVVEEIIRYNEDQIRKKLTELGFGDSRKFFEVPAKEIYKALLEKTQETDEALFNHFHKPDFSTTSGCGSLINATKEATGNLKGFFIKEEKAKELFLANPPKKIMSYLGYGNDVAKMIEKEDLFEIFAALRFVEDSDWLNNEFFKEYESLTKDDFEMREIKVMVLPERWNEITEKFLGKKLHPMSHLKEMGLVFVLPLKKDFPVKTLYLFFMTMHYIYEIDWHSRLFQKYSQSDNFIEKMVQALSVKVSERNLPDGEKMSWRIVPKYLAKNYPDDFRLKEPRINPEAWHYSYVADAIERFGKRFPKIGFDFWDGLNTVGDFFPPDSGKEKVLVSFDLFDNGISLLKKMNFESKYLYHQQEALWNRLFIEYMGEKKMDELMMEYLEKGFLILDTPPK